MLFIMEGIDLAGVVDSDFQGILIIFAPPRPAGFANFCGAGQDLLSCGAGRGRAALFPRGGAGGGGAHIPDRDPVAAAGHFFKFFKFGAILPDIHS